MPACDRDLDDDDEARPISEVYKYLWYTEKSEITRWKMTLDNHFENLPFRIRRVGTWPLYLHWSNKMARLRLVSRKLRRTFAIFSIASIRRPSETLLLDTGKKSVLFLFLNDLRATDGTSIWLWKSHSKSFLKVWTASGIAGLRRDGLRPSWRPANLRCFRLDILYHQEPVNWWLRHHEHPIGPLSKYSLPNVLHHITALNDASSPSLQSL